MTNAEIIKAIRENEECNNCALWKYDGCNERWMALAAADALEAADENIADYTAAIDALDDSNDAYIEENERLKKRIAELEAQLPKEGEWIEKWRFKTDGTPFHKIGDMECSVCHGDMLGRYYSKYCPHCGALLRGEHDERTDKA